MCYISNLHTTCEVTGLPWCDSDSGEVYKVYTVITEQYYNQDLFNLKPLIDLSQGRLRKFSIRRFMGKMVQLARQLNPDLSCRPSSNEQKPQLLHACLVNMTEQSQGKDECISSLYYDSSAMFNWGHRINFVFQGEIYTIMNPICVQLGFLPLCSL